MKYGIREICDVVLKAKSKMIVGNKVFYKDEPVIYFDSLKTSTMEGAATTVYAQGGRGNSRLIAWEGERTVTFTMEDALISTVGLAILTGADVIQDAALMDPVHVTETIEYNKDKSGWFVSKKPYQKDNEHLIYGMLLDNSGNPNTEPYIFKYDGAEPIVINGVHSYKLVEATKTTDGYNDYETALPLSGVMLIDYYYEAKKGTQIEITPDKFGGNFYLEASTLFRDTNGVDMPAEFIIPNCKVQSNFTFSMASSGDPSTFTFTMDAFPDYTRFNRTKKVLSMIQIIEEDGAEAYHRTWTDASKAHSAGTDVVAKESATQPIAEAAAVVNDSIEFATTSDAIKLEVDTYPANATYHVDLGDTTWLKYDNSTKALTIDGEVPDDAADVTIEIKDVADKTVDGKEIKGTVLDTVTVSTKNVETEQT